jgi:hypothetical protein
MRSSLVDESNRAYKPIRPDWPLFECLSWLPPNLTSPNTTSTLVVGGGGRSPSYMMNATDVEKIQLAVNFAR